MQQPKSNQFKTLQDVVREKDNPSLFVINSSNPRGNITFEVPDGMGGKAGVIIPSTWVPFDITTQVTKEVVLANPKFRQLLAAGYVKLPNEEYIRALSVREGYQSEYNRAHSSANSAQLDTDMTSEAKKAIDGDNVSGFVLNLVMSDEVTESDALNSIRLQEDSLTEDDLNYLINNSTHAKVKAEAADILNRRNS